MAKKKEAITQWHSWFGWLLSGVLLVVLFLQQGLGVSREVSLVPRGTRSTTVEQLVATPVAPTESSVSLLDLFELWLGSRDTAELPFSDGIPPKGTKMVAQLRINDCPPVPDGVCGSVWEIFAENETSSTVYIGTTGGGPMGYYGPYSVHQSLPKILEQARFIRDFTTL